MSEGLQRAAQQNFDLIILDLTLDDSSGFATFEKAQAALSHTPILVLSGLDNEQLALRAVAHGAQDYIRKSRLLDYPLDRAVRYAVERRRAQNELRESERFARSTVDSLSAQIAILDESGKIIAVNGAWKRFAQEGGQETAGYGIGSNYLLICEEACCGSGTAGHSAADGIRAVLHGEIKRFELEYPCHTAAQECFFLMRVTPVRRRGADTRRGLSRRCDSTQTRRAADRRTTQLARGSRGDGTHAGGGRSRTANAPGGDAGAERFCHLLAPTDTGQRPTVICR